MLSGPLATEHGAGGANPAGLADIAVMSGFGANMAEAADAAAAIAAIDDESVAYRLGRAHARIEAALSTPGIFGRVAISQTMRDVAPDLMDARDRPRPSPQTPRAPPSTEPPSTSSDRRR